MQGASRANLILVDRCVRLSRRFLSLAVVGR
jgi:hypothetical protein